MTVIKSVWNQTKKQKAFPSFSYMLDGKTIRNLFAGYEKTNKIWMRINTNTRRLKDKLNPWSSRQAKMRKKINHKKISRTKNDDNETNGYKWVGITVAKSTQRKICTRHHSQWNYWPRLYKYKVANKQNTKLNPKIWCSQSSPRLDCPLKLCSI